MKTAILILMSVFALSAKVFAGDGVTDPVGTIGCKANENLDIFIKSEDAKPFQKVKCKDLVRWSNTIDIKPDSDFIMEAFVFGAEKKEGFWWLKIKLIKENQFTWMKRAGFYNKPTLPGNELLREETEMSEMWDGKIYPKPEFKNPKAAQKFTNAIYKEIKTVSGRLWMRVEIIPSECIPAEEPPVLATGWVPFMHSDTESNFYERQDCEP